MKRLLAGLLMGAFFVSAAQAGQEVTLTDQQGNALGAAAPLGPVTSSTATSLKGSGTALYGYAFTQGTTAGFFALINAAAAPTAGAAITPIKCIPVAASGYVELHIETPEKFPAGIVALSTTSCTTYTANTPVGMELLSR